ncbi:hypothetical protein RND81_08G124200 [Saponaria officinalis]|uniref:Uncharacterized protein n=1 Tax=Saponaria officinalis TaxID=3572 RepID=A0AAW1J5W2_SAPOF
MSMKALEKELRHEKHYRYVSSHDVAYWSRSFVHELERASKDQYSKRCWGIGFGLGFRVVALSPSFRKLSVVSNMSIVKTPSQEVITLLNTLSDDPKNTVIIVSGRGRDSLGDWFSPCQKLGIATEHGYFLRWNKNVDWEISSITADNDWKRMAESVMQLHTEAIDGSYIESKESALVISRKIMKSYEAEIAENRELTALNRNQIDQSIK